MVIEKLSLKNTNDFNKLLKESNKKNSYRIGFYKHYNNKSIINKYFLKKTVKLFKIDNLYIGYIWTDIPLNNIVTIKDFYIKPKYIEFFNESIFKILNEKNIFYEILEDKDNLALLNFLNFNKVKSTNLLHLNIERYYDKDKKLKDIKLKGYKKGEDAKKRCLLQNDIFNNEGREPLNISDILFDERQEYFIQDMCFFILYQNNLAGYGQVVYNRGAFSIVNFGITKKYRGLGLSKIFLNKIIKICRLKGITDIYIRVEAHNLIARNLYNKIGFKSAGKFSTWFLEESL